MLQSFSVAFCSRFPPPGPGCQGQHWPRAQGAALVPGEGCATSQSGVITFYPRPNSSSNPLHEFNLLFAPAKSLYSWKAKSESIYLTIPVTFLGVFSHHIPPLSAFGQDVTNQIDPFTTLKEKAGRRGTCTSIYQI